MIKLIRLDERMIHGQVAIKWSRHLSVDRIIVANDAAAANAVVQKSLMMAAPPTAKVAIKSVQDTITMLKNPKAANHDILLIVANPDDLLEMVRNVEGIQAVNIGNYGRVAAKRGTESRKTYSNNLYAYPDEAEVLKQVAQSGIPTTVQTIPDDAPVDLMKLL